MRKNRSVSCRLSLGLGLIVAGCSVAETQPSSDYATDAAILRSAIYDLYPSIDRYDQEGDVQAALAELSDVAENTANDMEFYKAVVAVAAATRDEHVIPFPPDSYREYRRNAAMMLPYTIVWRDEVPYIASIADPEYQVYVGARVVEFDGIDAETIRDVLLPTIPSDGNSKTFALRHLQDFTPTQNENYFDLNYSIWLGEQDVYEISLLQNESNNETTLALDSLNWRDFSDYYRARLPRERPVTFRWVDNEVAYLEINSFHDWYYAEHDVDAKTELQRIFSKIAQRANTGLILDLRRNEGGGDISSLLLDYLMTDTFKEYDRVLTGFVGRPDSAVHCSNSEDVAFDPSWATPRGDGLYELRAEFSSLITGATERQPNSDRFSGALIVLISGSTGSAAAKVSAMLTRRADTTFVGEETGGAAEGATAFGNCSLRLPKSGITVDIPLIRFEREVNVPTGRGVLPDISTDVTKIGSSSDETLRTAIEVLRER